MTTTNSVVANAIKAQAVRNSVEVEISPGYAARVQHAMRDAARAVSGVRMTSSNTLECRDEDAADDVIDILKQAGLPDGEVWTNARRTARNAEASQKLRNAWHSAFDALKDLYAAAQAERHSAVADAANKAVKTLMDNTKDLGIS